MRPLVGTGFSIWQAWNVLGGDAQKIAELAQTLKLRHVIVKIADGPYVYNIYKNGLDLVPPIVVALQKVDICVYAWAYIYGQDSREPTVIGARARDIGFDGVVLNAEKEFETKGAAAPSGTHINIARDEVAAVRQIVGAMPIGIESFRYPSYHPTFPIDAFLKGADWWMPEVYWEQAHNPDVQLRAAYAEAQARWPAKLCFPIGPSYMDNTGTWWPSAAEVTLFLQTAQQLGLAGADLFSWDECLRLADGQEIQDAVGAFSFSPPSPAPQPKPPFLSLPDTQKWQVVQAGLQRQGLVDADGRVV